MRRPTKVIAAVIATIMVVVFFFAPVVWWFNMGSPIAGVRMTTPVYRSLGCATLGYGDLYAPGWFGFSFGCNIPVIMPV
jgi:hypothetical protein